MTAGTLEERGLASHSNKKNAALDANRNSRLDIYNLPLSTRCSRCYSKSSVYSYLPFLPCYIERDFKLFTTVSNWCRRTCRKHQKHLRTVIEIDVTVNES